MNFFNSLVMFFVLIGAGLSAHAEDEAVISCSSTDNFYIWIFNKDGEYSVSGFFYDKNDGDVKKSFSDIPLKVSIETPEHLYGTEVEHFLLAQENDLFTGLDITALQPGQDRIVYSTYNSGEKLHTVYHLCERGHYRSPFDLSY